jgi:hypothetical protein
MDRAGCGRGSDRGGNWASTRAPTTVGSPFRLRCLASIRTFCRSLISGVPGSPANRSGRALARFLAVCRADRKRRAASEMQVPGWLSCGRPMATERITDDGRGNAFDQQIDVIDHVERTATKIPGINVGADADLLKAPFIRKQEAPCVLGAAPCFR